MSVTAVAGMGSIKNTVVKTASGAFYAYQSGASPQWIKTTWPYPERTQIRSYCLGMKEGRASAPGKILDCDGISAVEGFIFEDYYAVLEDGSVWRWQYGHGYDSILTLFLCASGPILGVITGVLLSKFARRIIFKSPSASEKRG